MLSIKTNGAAIGALDILRATIDGRGETQSRVTTGYRVAQASDDAAYWSIATTMRSDNKALSAVEDALGMAGAIVDTAYNGVDSAVDVMQEIKTRMVLAREPGVDRDKINTEIVELKEQLKTITHASSFSGQNWLWRTDVADDAPKQLVGSFRRDADGGVTVTNVDYDVAGVAGTSEVNFLIDDVSGDSGILTGSGFAAELGTAKSWVMFNGESGPTYDEMVLNDSVTDTEIEEMISVIDAMAERATDVGTTLGALVTRVELQSGFVMDLQDSIHYGVGKMVDADMDLESTRLKALETKEQLGIQALAIANASTEPLISLLR
ncbi:flagellin [Agrobacterium sp. a22-2]|uniref:flagellin N-terminal helical domain-containing protein n=1 Tax=Agrobacterium sp. a22-2 TaxID=2283840 RepID=UPI0014480848|nr:flagellin [Agrobacterium sp. a22-2]NKN39500.1 flagellin [Agrobacterium sp. a22-2]